MLSGGMANWSSPLFPGGNYTVMAHYAGDGTRAASDSNVVSVSISPESSKTFVTLLSWDVYGNFQPLAGNTIPYGSIYILTMDVTDAAGSASASQGVSSNCVNGLASCPTGTLTLTANGAALDGGSFGLNSIGHADDQTVQLPVGTYNLAASYPGDASYGASIGTATVGISKAATALSASTAVPGPYQYGTPFQINSQLATTSSGAGPTGVISFLDNGLAAGNSIQSITQNSNPGGAKAYANLTYSGRYAPSYLGAHTLSAQYPGDSNYSSSAATGFSFNVTQATTSASGGIVPNTATPSTSVTMSVNISSSSQLEQPTGTVTFYDNGTPIAGTVTYSGHAGSSTSSAALSASLSATFAQVGTHNISAQYSGDAHYQSSQSTSSALVVQKLLAVTLPVNQVSDPSSGGTGSATVNVANNTASLLTVNLTCSPDSAKASCSIPPTVNVAGSGVMNATVNYTVPAFSASNTRSGNQFFSLAIVFGGVLAGACFTTRRKRLIVASLLGAALLLTMLSCGGGGGGTPSTPGGSTAPSSKSYTFTITATSGTNTDAQVLTITVAP